MKDICAVLQWVENPKDHDAGRRVLLLLHGVGKKTLADFTPQF